MFRFQISLVLYIINGTAKTKVAILPFLCCREFVKTSIRSQVHLNLNNAIFLRMLSLVREHLHLSYQSM